VKWMCNCGISRTIFGNPFEDKISAINLRASCTV
jgi:hypothetical protein